MLSNLARLSVFVALGFGLSGCLEDPAVTGMAPAPAPVAAPVVDSAAYAARKDGNFTIPAVPVEKVPPQFTRQSVAYTSDQPVGTIIIDPAKRFLYLITGRDQALRYGISVGRAGFEWHGEAIVSNRRNWPTWTPPPEMIERDPKLEKWKNGQPGGPQNPLGARALYLTTNGRDYGYRIHGTPDWWSIGRNASSGCIRMIHQDVIDLEQRVQNGAKVIVLTKDGQVPKGLKLPPPQPRKATPKPAPQPEVIAAVPAPEAAQDPTPNAQPPALPETGATDQPPQAASTPTAIPPVAEAPAAPVVAPLPVTPAVPDCTVPLVNGVCPTP